MVYRIPMSNILGEEGNGIYAVAFEIYDLILIISSYSLPLALSKMISARQANREHKNTGRILKVALRFAIIYIWFDCINWCAAFYKGIFPQ